jgi:uncharacterized protein (TIGR02266 family)
LTDRPDRPDRQENDRRDERIALALEVEFRNVGAFLVAYSTNLSKGGMFVEMEDPLPVGTEIAMRFAVPGAGEPPIDVIGVVTWVQAWRTELQPRGMGVRFDHLEARHGEAIDRIVSGFRGLRVLVLSTDASSRAQIVRSLRTIIGTAEIIEVSDGENAEQALARDCDLVIVELMGAPLEPGMSDPGGAGDALLCMRLAKAHQPPVPVLAVSSAEDRRQLARELGADLTLVSPPQFPELQTAVIRLLGRPQSTALK